MATENKVRINWFRTPLSKEDMRRLTTKSNLHGLLQIITQFVLTAALGVAAFYAFYHYPWYFFVPVYYLYATVFSFIGMSGAGHELSHGTVFKNRATLLHYLAGATCTSSVPVTLNIINIRCTTDLIWKWCSR